MLFASAARSAVVANGFARRNASTIASKYSKAVFGAALSKSPATLNKVATELATISGAIKASPEVANFISNPTLSAADRQKGIQNLISKVEGTGAKKDPASEVTKNLLALLSDNGRLQETEGVIEGFNELFAEHKGELTVTVTSAAPLPKDLLTRLESTLKQSQTAQKAKVVKISNKVTCSSLPARVLCAKIEPLLRSTPRFSAA
jgi:F-type H+-transporting ATPase subunit O